MAIVLLVDDAICVSGYGTPVSRKTAPGPVRRADRSSVLSRNASYDVHVDQALNASATEMRGLLGLMGTRRVLTPGVLLLLMTKDELLAVVAHEFGHFSRRHGRLGQWFYRPTWLVLEHAYYVDASSSSRSGGRSIRQPTCSSVHLLCTFSAVRERGGCGRRRIGGASIFAQALCKIAVADRWFERRLPFIVADWELRCRVRRPIFTSGVAAAFCQRAARSG